MSRDWRGYAENGVRAFKGVPYAQPRFVCSAGRFWHVTAYDNPLRG